MLMALLAQLIGLFRFRRDLRFSQVSENVGVTCFSYKGKHYDRNLFIRLRMETIQGMSNKGLTQSRDSLLTQLSEGDVQRKALNEAELEAIERLISGQEPPPFECPPAPVRSDADPVAVDPAPPVMPTSTPVPPPSASPSSPTPTSSLELLEQLRDEVERERQDEPLPAKHTRSPLTIGLGVISAALLVAVCVLGYQLVSANQKIEALAQSNQTLVASLSRVDEANIFQAAVDFFKGADDYIDYIENKDSRTHMRLSRMKFGIPENAPDSVVDMMAKAHYLDEKHDLRNTILNAIGAKSIIIVASSQSDKYHTLSCNYVEQILSENRIYYATAKEAEADGKTPCSICRP